MSTCARSPGCSPSSPWPASSGPGRSARPRWRATSSGTARRARPASISKPAPPGAARRAHARPRQAARAGRPGRDPATPRPLCGAARPGRSPRTPARFLVLGSASPESLRQSTETLAGRIAFHELSGFNLIEVGASSLDRLWLRGGFPRSFLAKTEKRSAAWRREFIRSFLERDLPQLGIRIPAATMRRFWSMLAHHHAELWNSSEYARALGVADHTVRRYLDLLSATFAVRQLQPWHENLGKRQVRATRIYVRDSGLLHALLGLQTMADLEGHPKIGASWEGFALENVIRHLGARAEESYFWRTHAGAELDLLIVRGRRRLGFEFKLTDAPAVTPSMRSALRDLRLERLDVVHAGEETFPLAKTVRAVSLRAMTADLRPLPGG